MRLSLRLWRWRLRLMNLVGFGAFLYAYGCALGGDLEGGVERSVRFLAELDELTRDALKVLQR